MLAELNQQIQYSAKVVKVIVAPDRCWREPENFGFPPLEPATIALEFTLYGKLNRPHQCVSVQENKYANIIYPTKANGLAGTQPYEYRMRGMKSKTPIQSINITQGLRQGRYVTKKPLPAAPTKALQYSERKPVGQWPCVYSRGKCDEKW